MGCLQARRAGHGRASSSGTQSSPTPVDQGVWQAVTGGFKEELAALKEGAMYISAPKNRSAALCTRSLSRAGLLSVTLLSKNRQQTPLKEDIFMAM